MDGGLGRDRASYREAQIGLRADLANAASNTGGAAGDTYIDIEELEGSDADDILGATHRRLALRIRRERLDRRPDRKRHTFRQRGNDTLVDGEGRDRFEGGNGIDDASYESSPLAMRIDLLTRRSPW